MFKITNFIPPKKIIEELSKEAVKEVLGRGYSLQEMVDILSKKAVQKRVLKRLRESPAIEFDYKELMQVCRLAHDGVVENTQDFEDKWTEIGEEYNNLENLNAIFSPLGNMVIGHKAIKDYCQDYISDEEYKKMQSSYNDAKIKVDKVLGSMVDELGAWEREVKFVGREHGVFPTTGRTPPVLYNIEEIGIRYPELATIVKKIKDYRALYPDKEYMNFKGMKTVAFEKYLKKIKKMKKK